MQSADQSEVGNARRQAQALGSSLDFTERRCGELAIVVTEAARNLATHGGGGELILTPWKMDELSGVDMLALDHGPGIPNVVVALQDGYSTAGTPGNGLGAIERLAQHTEVYSPAGKGTAVLARLLASEEMNADRLPKFGSVVVPFGEETTSGDAWGISYSKDRTVYLMADGLGHGPIASEAGQQAMRTFHENAHLQPRQLLLALHAALQKTRGAAVGIAEISHERKSLTYIGAGNIASSLCCSGRTRSLVSMNGTAGHNMGTLQEFTYPLGDDRLLLMHSDGLLTRWQLAEYPGLASRHPALIAGVLYRDFSRRRDDATVLVIGLSK
ncbi:MAG: ATP-binding SpoIIE family protein phosphatase [Janthinobacterium lividum]